MNFEELNQRCHARRPQRREPRVSERSETRRVFASALLFVVLTAAAPVVARQGARRGRGSQSPTTTRPPAAGQALDRGRVEGATYTNEYFGFSFDIPADWTVHDTLLVRQIEDGAKNVFRGEQDARLKRELEAAVERTTMLLSTSKYPPGSPEPFNATLVCAAERVPTAVVKTPADYYRLALHSLRLSREIDVQVVEPFRTKTVGPHTFGLYTLRLSFNLGVTVQRQLVMVKGPYVFGLVFSYADESDAKTFEQVLASVRVAARRKT